MYSVQATYISLSPLRRIAAGMAGRRLGRADGMESRKARMRYLVIEGRKEESRTGQSLSYFVRVVLKLVQIIPVWLQLP